MPARSSVVGRRRGFVAAVSGAGTLALAKSATDEDKEVFCRYKVGMLDSNYGMDGSPIGSQGAPLLMIKQTDQYL